MSDYDCHQAMARHVHDGFAVDLVTQYQAKENQKYTLTIYHPAPLGYRWHDRLLQPTCDVTSGGGTFYVKDGRLFGGGDEGVPADVGRLFSNGAFNPIVMKGVVAGAGTYFGKPVSVFRVQNFRLVNGSLYEVRFERDRAPLPDGAQWVGNAIRGNGGELYATSGNAITTTCGSVPMWVTEAMKREGLV